MLLNTPIPNYDTIFRETYNENLNLITGINKKDKKERRDSKGNKIRETYDGRVISQSVS